MNDIPTIAFIGLPLLTGCIGVGLGHWLGGAPTGDEGYWQAIAERERERADKNWRKFVDAAKECNRLQADYDRASDLVGKYQSKQPLRGKDGKFAPKAVA